ncbi:amidohydrolase family protein [Halotalea alkalilenta]|uniref:Cytosine deaminase n=1 Tax=Halotalea alkalilenta TaxID=376489 RepID=A0A172YA79_9GAMM|nr:amidohydrolase family protein [Halotalea alkalilenta]ANF56138.1 cytosine deaminase [Halotalea alkalilenta]
MNDLLLKSVRPWGDESVDLLIRDGRIAAMAPHLTAEGVEVIDGKGHIALPGLVDAHTHLDKSLLGWPWYRNEVGAQLLDKIDNERQVRQALGLDAQVQSMRHALRSLAFGTTLIRSHVDIDTEQGLKALEGVIETRRRLCEVLDIELVAFPQSGVMRRPGTIELLDRALALGADLLGGLDPCAIDRDPKGQLDVLFELAEKHGKGIDLHLHETGELGAFSMALIFERIRAHGMQGQVSISHAFCLGAPDWQRTQALIDECAELGVTILTTAPASREVPAIQRLIAAGVPIGVGNDGVRDTWGPYGNADMLERAKLLGLRNNLRRDDEIELALGLCSYRGARAIGHESRRLKVGERADLFLATGETVAETVVTHAPRALVISHGRVVARNGEALLPTP